MHNSTTKEDYEVFAREFAEFLYDEHPEVCFFVYGSFSRGDYVPGRSDIDGGLIFPEGVVLPSDEVRDIAKVMAIKLGKSRLKFQVNLMDMKTCADGRFNSFTADYIQHILEEHKILSGPNVLPKIKEMDYKSGVLSSAAFNLRSVRRKFLHSMHDYFTNPKLCDENLRKSIDKTLKFPKKLFWLQGKDIITDRKETFEELEKMFPGFDVLSLERLSRAREKDLTANFGHAIDTYAESARVIEELTDRYLNAFPDVTVRETRA